MLGVTEKWLESTESSIGSKSGAAAKLTSPPTVIVSDRGERLVFHIGHF